MLDKYNFISMEYISGKIKLSKNWNNKKLIFKIARVYDWYDETITLSGEGIVKDGYLLFKINNGLEKGLYEILAIKDEQGNVLYGEESNNINPIDAFLINNLKEKNALDICKKVHIEREAFFTKPKYICNKDKAIPFDVYIFCKNIKIDVNAQYEDIEIFPYEYLKMTSEVNYINSFFKEKVNIDLTVHSEKYEHELPSAVFYMCNIMALDYEQAKEYALKKADILNNIYTTLLGSHGTYFAVITLNKKEKMSQISILDTRYKGNLFLWAENGFNIRQYYKYLNKENGYLTVYMKLLNEAKNEENRMLKYYRYWNILEGIASLKNFKKMKMKKWDGTIVCNKKGQELDIGEKALNNVFELIRSNFSKKSEMEFLGKIEYIKSVKEFLNICYQRRNCCAHRGNCYSQDKNICLATKDKMCNCKKNNIIHIEEPIPFQDIILRKLQEITTQIILNELNKNTGQIIKEDIIVESLLK